MDFEPLPQPLAGEQFEIISWTNPQGGAYAEVSNWDPQRVPTASCEDGDTAVFDIVQAPDIFVDADGASAGYWRFLNGRYRVHGSAELLSTSPNSVSLEISRDALVQLTQGSLKSVHSRIGNALGTTTGRMDVLLPLTVWENAGFLNITNGHLEVSSGGEAHFENLFLAGVEGASASATVSGNILGTRSHVVVAENLVMGNGGSAVLDISDGARLDAFECDIGDRSDATVEIGGSSNPADPHYTPAYAVLCAEGLLKIGGAGAATLRVNKGGAAIGDTVMISPGGIGQGGVVLDGQGEFAALNALTRLIVHGSNQVEVEAVNGGRIVAESIEIGGGTVAGSADVTIRGSATQPEPRSQSVIATKDLPSTMSGAGGALIGADGPGQLNILAGAFGEFAAGLWVGHQARGIVIVTGQGAPDGQTSRLSVTGPTNVGWDATGFLQLGDGATMDTIGNVTIGNGADGTMTLNNGAILNVNGTLQVGLFGSGTLNASAASSVDCNTLLLGGGDQVSNMTLRGSELRVYGNAEVGLGIGAGVLELIDSSVLTLDGTMTIGQVGLGVVGLTGSTIRGTGNIEIGDKGSLVGTGSVELCSVCTILNGGTISPGLSPGTLTIHGDYVQFDPGRLEIEYAGLGPGKFDRLIATGSATLGGRLEIHFRDGFSPADPDSFIHSQDFVEADQGTIGDYEERVYVFPDEFADFDDDGDKDLFDVAAFQNCIVETGALSKDCLRADWENDGVIGGREVQELGKRLNGPQ